jgi:mannan endo-1,6-alpha-mannosidase
MYEQACEPSGTCNIDQSSFKAYLSRWMAATTRLVPSLKPQIMSLLQASAVAAANQCTDGHYGATCGRAWYLGTNDGNSGVGPQMCALEVIGSLLVASTPDLATNMTGGTSVGDYTAGGNTDATLAKAGIEVTKGGTAGAAIITVMFCCGVVGSVWFMLGTDGWVG